MKGLFSFLGGIVAFFLCILLIVSLIAYPVISFATDSLDPTSLAKALLHSGVFPSFSLEESQPAAAGRLPVLMANGVASPSQNLSMDDLLAFLQQSSGTEILESKELLNALGLPENTDLDQEKLFENLAQSELAQELVTAYGADIVNAAMGSTETTLTVDTVLNILTPHMDEVVEIVKECLPEGTVVDEEKMTEAVTSTMQQTLPTLVQNLPPARDLADQLIPKDSEELKSVLEAVNFVRQGTLRTICLGVIAGLALLIVLFRLPTLRGLRWVGIGGLLAAVCVGGLGYLLKTELVVESLHSAMDALAKPILELLTSMSGTFLNTAILYGVVGVVLIVVAGLTGILFRKK